MTHAAVSSAMRWALFLDVDGTLLELAATPEQVVVTDRLKLLLTDLSRRMEGAIALISGRTIRNLDTLFAPAVFCAAGVHGAELRGPRGALQQATIDDAALRQAHVELTNYVRTRTGLLLEDKGAALALHYRLAPHLQPEVHARIATVLDRLGPDFALQVGKCVYEIRPRAWNKGSAVRELMGMPPFAGRTPIYLGDDVTDEHAFAAVNALGGLSIRVGDRPIGESTCAHYRLDDVAAVHCWLAALPPPPSLDRIQHSSRTQDSADIAASSNANWTT
jgi:trehalose 6-phosphate phosphatase